MGYKQKENQGGGSYGKTHAENIKSTRNVPSVTTRWLLRGSLNKYSSFNLHVLSWIYFTPIFFLRKENKIGKCFIAY